MFSMLVITCIAFTTAVYVIFNFEDIVSAVVGQSGKQNAGVARTLLERASAINGQNPHEAKELRQSAMAFLSVAR